MKPSRFTIVLLVVLVILSIGLFALQHIIFNEPKESGFLFFQDLAFLPLDVLFVSLILDKIINAREKREKLEQINIVISAFYSEVGSDAIRVLNLFIGNIGGFRELLGGMEEWTGDRYGAAARCVLEYRLEADSRAGDLEAAAGFLIERKGSMLLMFENPNLLENNRFTGMLWAVYHLQDELSHRDGFENLPESDLDHLSRDIERAYKLLVAEWIYYMRHLKEKYPYLFSLALRKNPFEERKSVVVY